jgi:hypothetical protein
VSETLLSAGIDCCRRAGAAVTRSDDTAEPPAVARRDPPTGSDAPEGDDWAASPAGGRGARGSTPDALLTEGGTVAIEPLPDADPTTVLSRLWNNRNNGRGTLFVVPDGRVADAVERLLSPPVGVAEADEAGRRFHAGPDRIPLEEGGYAAVPTGEELVWRESRSATDGVGIHLRDSGSGPEAGAEPTGAGGKGDGDEPYLELRAGGTVLARLAGVDALACPPRASFPYAYHRDGDKQIRVLDFAGRPVQRYPGVAAMRRGGFRPVPAPLVPEHMFDDATEGWWAVLSAAE